ncbi:ATP-binding protein [Streptomyces humicola]|uniref:ATP-binding protein n=1 Tax=Streptomyces humicola TaxID=2953240 RepID=UPI003558238F
MGLPPRQRGERHGDADRRGADRERRTPRRVPGRDFRLRILAGRETVRIEVTDTRDDRMPPECPAEPAPDAEAGRGLWLVEQLAAGWAANPRTGAPGKTVWAEVKVPSGA